MKWRTCLFIISQVIVTVTEIHRKKSYTELPLEKRIVDGLRNTETWRENVIRVYKYSHIGSELWTLVCVFVATKTIYGSRKMNDARGRVLLVQPWWWSVVWLITRRIKMARFRVVISYLMSASDKVGNKWAQGWCDQGLFLMQFLYTDIFTHTLLYIRNLSNTFDWSWTM